MYIEGLDFPTLEGELHSLFETAPEFRGDDWEEAFYQVVIEDQGLGFEVVYDGDDEMVYNLLVEFLELIAKEYNGLFNERY
tara:strand:- start:539 stop:781 length:243 start_codon:yes stop_codon:yes gene_type:complete